MPEMDGYDATREIRNPESAVRNHDIPIIAMTAHVMERDRKKCLSAGMNDFISKPVVPNILVDTIEKWLSNVDQSQSNEKVLEKTATVVFDLVGLLDRLMGDEDLAKEIIEKFLEVMPHQIIALKEALEKGDASLISRMAHTIKGASANVGAVALQEVVSQMEKASEESDLEKAISLVPEIDREAEILKKTLAQKRSDLWNGEEQ